MEKIGVNVLIKFSVSKSKILMRIFLIGNGKSVKFEMTQSKLALLLYSLISSKYTPQKSYEINGVIIKLYLLTIFEFNEALEKVIADLAMKLFISKISWYETYKLAVGLSKKFNAYMSPQVLQKLFS